MFCTFDEIACEKTTNNEVMRSIYCKATQSVMLRPLGRHRHILEAQAYIREHKEQKVYKLLLN